MKKCKCGCLYANDYAGSCGDCGAGMGFQTGEAPQLVWSAPAAAQRAAQVERQIQAHDHNNMRFDANDPVLEAARDMVLDFRSPEQRARDDEYGL